MNAERPSWTQEESIAFECALDCIRHLIAIYVSQTYKEEANSSPDHERLNALKASIDILWKERRSVHVTDQQNVARVTEQYSQVIRKYMKTGHVDFLTSSE